MGSMSLYVMGSVKPADERQHVQNAHDGLVAKAHGTQLYSFKHHPKSTEPELWQPRRLPIPATGSTHLLLSR